ncbi:MAG: carboxypeptidase regulatory-like domain-containing protein [Candidatus Omnitrophica bacterium]|nr:carboxypeptidase regulatory-like domain-containing protein [Candidatus Omnitrophota bacterium]
MTLFPYGRKRHSEDDPSTSRGLDRSRAVGFGVTDAKGRFDVCTDVERAIVEVRTSDGRRGWASFSGVRALVYVAPGGLVRCAGKVLDETGAAVVGATVAETDGFAGIPDVARSTTLTGEDGAFALDVACLDETTLTVTTPGGSPQTVTVRPHRTQPVSLVVARTTALRVVVVDDGTGSPVRASAVIGGVLNPDDIAAVASIYPVPNNAQTLGSISGRITIQDMAARTTSDLCGAHVIALGGVGSIPVASALSGPDGTYRIDGLAPGNYRVLVEPSSPADLQDLYSNLSDLALDFHAELYSNAYLPETDRAATVVVNGGVATSGIDVEVIKTVPVSEITYAAGGETDDNGEPVVVKIEPDDTLADATRLRDEDRDNFIVVNDRIQFPGDRDTYLLHANRDDVWSVEVFADRNGSPLDPLLSLFGPGIQAVPFATADNTIGLGKDARIIFTAPEVNNYFIQITDAAGMGSNNHFYSLVIKKLSGRIPVTPLGGPTAVLSVPISDADLVAAGFTDPTFGHVSITELKVQFLDVDGDAGLNPDGRDFLPPARSHRADLNIIEGGFILFKDDGIVPGVFDYDPVTPDPAQDSPVALSEAPTIQPFGFGFEVTFRPEEPLVLPAERPGATDATPDFHIVIQPSLMLHHGDDFQVIIPKDGIRVRNNNAPPPQPEVTLFSQPYPPPFERNKYTGDIVEPRSFVPTGSGFVDVRSIDYATVGLNLIGDPAEEYWISQVELSFVGYSFHRLKGIAFFDFLELFFPYQTDPRHYGWDLTDLLPLTNGTVTSGGVSLYQDNDNLGTAGDGVPNFGLNGDVLIPLTGTQRFEVFDIDDVPQEILVGLLPHHMQQHITVDDFLLFRDEVGVNAFKAILPVLPQADRLVPSSNRAQDGTLGADMFITIRTSHLAKALDVFIPYVQVDGIRVSNNLSEVIAFQDPTRSTLVNGRTLRPIDSTTSPSTALVEVRPSPTILLKDMVNPADPSSRGNIIGSSAEGAPPLAVLGIDAEDSGSSALVSYNASGSTDILSGVDVVNTGLVLDSIRVFIDPVDSPPEIPAPPQQFIANIFGTAPPFTLSQQTLIDSDTIDLPDRGIEIMVDDDTTTGDFLDNDGDGLVDEELLNDTDDDLDGITDEGDQGDGDAPGLNGQLDPNDDVIAFLQFNDINRFTTVYPFTSYAAAPVVSTTGEGSLLIDYTDLTGNSQSEEAFAFDLAAEPLSQIFFDSVFFRIDHPVLVSVPAQAAPSVGANFSPPFQFPHGFYIDYGDDLTTLFDAGTEVVNYYFRTEIPNSNGINALIGPDFFVSVRMGPDALNGDSFRVRIPENGIGYSAYRSVTPVGLDVRPGAAPVGDFSSSRVRVGTDNFVPSLTYLKPIRQNNRAREVLVDGRVEYEFEVEFTFEDPDNDAQVDFFWDTDRFGLDGKEIPPAYNQSTTNIIDNDGERPMRFIFRFPGELARKTFAEAYIYGIVTDDVNPPKPIYAPTAIILDATSRSTYNPADFILADNLGQIFGTGGANANIPEFRQNRNIIRDFELTPAERGGLYLHGEGRVVLRGDPDPWADFVRTGIDVTFPQGAAPFMGMDLFRDLEPDFRNNGFYLLDAMGGVHPVGAVPPAGFSLAGAPMLGTDLARDMELTATGLGLLILDGTGRTYALGDAPQAAGAPAFSFDIARDVVIAPGGNGFYMLDGFGGIYTIGDARAFDTTDIPFFPGSDVFRGISVVPGGAGLLVLDREGQVYGAGDVLLGPNPVPPNAISEPAGVNPGDPIVFTPPNNVVTGELGGAFIDIESAGTGTLPQQGTDILESLCRAIVLEDLQGVLRHFSTDFVDDQGHGLTDLSSVWKQFFDYFKVISCRIGRDSVRVSQDATGFVVSASFEIAVLNPSLTVFAPADDPLILDVVDDDFDPGPFIFGPVLIDQVARFWETGDGRGWRLSIIDDDYNEGRIDRADRIMAERHFTKTRTQASREGEGTIFFEEEDIRSEGSSTNSEYIFRFIEEVEGFGGAAEEQLTPPGGSIGGWHQPVLYVLALGASGGDEGGGGEGDIDVFQTVLFELPVSFRVRVLNQGGAIITGGEQAVFGTIPIHEALVGDVVQNDEINETVNNPGAWRFFPKPGITVDAGRENIVESHLRATAGPEDASITLEVSDPNSSAFLVNLTEMDRLGSLPPDIIPLPTNLRMLPEEVNLLPFGAFQKSIQVSAGNDVLITFSRNEQRGVRDRLIYATFRITSVVDAVDEGGGGGTGITGTDVENCSFIWRYSPTTDFVTNMVPFK